MVDYGLAIKRPFTNFKKLLIGILFFFIIVLAQLFINIPALFIILLAVGVITLLCGYGYMLECAKTSMKKKYALPEWKNFKNLFIKGLLTFIIGAIYAIPFAILLLITFIVGGAPFFSAASGGNPAFDLSSLFTAGIIFLIAIIVGVVISYISSLAVIKFAEKNRFGDAFKFGEILRKAFTKQYFKVWIAVFFYSILLGIVLSFIPWVGGPLSSFVAGVTSFTLLGSVYPKLK